jgi:hypothetical protein
VGPDGARGPRSTLGWDAAVPRTRTPIAPAPVGEPASPQPPAPRVEQAPERFAREVREVDGLPKKLALSGQPGNGGNIPWTREVEAPARRVRKVDGGSPAPGMGWAGPSGRVVGRIEIASRRQRAHRLWPAGTCAGAV